MLFAHESDVVGKVAFSVVMARKLVIIVCAGRD